ncbi:MAG: IDEAL domain-containing protein [Sporolactobacillus sp.]|jgi:uncharacterized protein YpiB (UPF0302 family)|nr:IDEAL domain-containing protein [Sporolactobacillus sp.]MCI1882162.1 IDEAL domain-containing protein [Sporolactobacillus sp.]
MNNDHSSQQNAKALVVYKEQQAKVSVMEIYAQMVLDEVEFNHKLKLLKAKIDASLDTGDKLLFIKLTDEYKTMIR